MKKFIYILIISILLVTSCRYDMYHRDFYDYKDEFLELYNSGKEINEIKTNGFYYRLDSSMSYLIQFPEGAEYKDKDLIDYSGGTKYKILDTNKAYFFFYFWLLKNSRSYEGAYWRPYPNFKGPETFILPNNINISIDSVENIICEQIEKYYCNRFKSFDDSKCSKGVYSIRYKTIRWNSILCYYHDIVLFNFFGKIKNDSTLLIFDDFYKNKPVPYNKRFWTFKFHQTDVFPSDKYMRFK